MQKVFQLITKISLWVLVSFVGSIVLSGPLYFFLESMGSFSGFIYLPLFLIMICRMLAVLCSVFIGLKLVALCLVWIIHKYRAIEIAFPKVSSSQVRNDALILGALILLVVTTNNPVSGEKQGQADCPMMEEKKVAGTEGSPQKCL